MRIKTLQLTSHSAFQSTSGEFGIHLGCFEWAAEALRLAAERRSEGGMIHHASLPVASLDRSTALYDAALGALGYRRVLNAPGFAGYGSVEGRDRLALKETAEPEPAGPGFHLAFAAPSREAVDAFHAAALVHGAADNGPPGLRPYYGPTYYAAFIVDLDGHRIEAVHKG